MNFTAFVETAMGYDAVSLLFALIIAVFYTLVKKRVKNDFVRSSLPFASGAALYAVYALIFAPECLTASFVLGGGAVAGSLSYVFTALTDAVNTPRLFFSTPTEAAVYEILKNYGENAKTAASEIARKLSAFEDNLTADNKTEILSVLSERFPKTTEAEREAIFCLIENVYRNLSKK